MACVEPVPWQQSENISCPLCHRTFLRIISVALAAIAPLTGQADGEHRRVLPQRSFERRVQPQKLDADLVFDVRCLPNPHYEPALRRRSLRALEQAARPADLNESHFDLATERRDDAWALE